MCGRASSKTTQGTRTICVEEFGISLMMEHHTEKDLFSVFDFVLVRGQCHTLYIVFATVDVRLNSGG